MLENVDFTQDDLAVAEDIEKAGLRRRVAFAGELSVISSVEVSFDEMQGRSVFAGRHRNRI